MTMKSNDEVWWDTGKVPEVAEGEPLAIHVGGQDLVLLRSKSGLKLFDGRCPHQGALLGEGEISDGLLICRNHRWKFDCETGERRGGTTACLKQFEFKVDNGHLQVKIEKELTNSTDTATRIRQPAELPGPKGELLLGNARQIDKDSLHLVLEKWAEDYGTPYTFKLGLHRLVVVSDPKAVAGALRDRPDTYCRSRRLKRVFDELGVDGVFSAEGHPWRTQRKLAMHALSHRNLKSFYPVLETMARRLQTRWNRFADTDTVVDIQDDLMRFTVDVTTMLAFGHDVNTLEKGDDVIQRHMEKVFPALSRRLQSVVPYWRVFRLPKDREVDNAIQAIRDWLFPIVAATRERIKAQPELAAAPSNFLEAMISSRDENGQPFTEDVIFGNAMTMLLAGEDTTANTIAWAVHHLLDRPESVSRLEEELQQALGDTKVPVNREVAQGLTFASAIANESMRVRPIAPQLILDVNKPVVLDSVAITPDTGVIVLTRPSAIDEKIMPNGKEFIPERWLDPETAKRAQKELVHIPFGSGPRICPGRSLALLEMNIVLAVLYKNFRVERVGQSSDVKELFSFTMTPVNLRVKLHSR